MPHAVAYVLDKFSWWLALHVLKPLVMEKDIHVAMANVLAIAAEKQGNGPIQALFDAGFHIPCQECGRPLFVPELLQDQATPENLARWVTRFISEEPLRQATIAGFKQIRSMLAPPAHGKTAAQIVLECVEQSSRAS
jgi:hypothetical protein